MAREPNKNHGPVGKDQFSSPCRYFHDVMLSLCPDHTLNVATVASWLVPLVHRMTSCFLLMICVTYLSTTQ